MHLRRPAVETVRHVPAAKGERENEVVTLPGRVSTQARILELRSRYLAARSGARICKGKKQHTENASCRCFGLHVFQSWLRHQQGPASMRAAAAQSHCWTHRQRVGRDEGQPACWTSVAAASILVTSHRRCLRGMGGCHKMAPRQW